MASETEINPNAVELGNEAGPTTSMNPSSSWGESVRAELEARNREGDQRVVGLTREVDDQDLHPPYFEPQVFHDPAELSSEGDPVPVRTAQSLDMGDMATALDAALGALPDLENEGEVAARRLEQSPGHLCPVWNVDGRRQRGKVMNRADAGLHCTPCTTVTEPMSNASAIQRCSSGSAVET